MDCGEPPHEREPVTTIAWRLVHLIVGFASTNGKLFGRAAASDSTFCYAGTAGGALRQLDDEYEHWVDGVRSLGIAGLAQPQGDPPAFAHAPLAKKMLYANVEVIHHGAEICLLRDPLIIGLIYSTLLVAVRNSGDLSSFLRGGPPSSPVPAWWHQRITRRPAMRTADA
jgi:hypothetical protein